MVGQKFIGFKIRDSCSNFQFGQHFVLYHRQIRLDRDVKQTRPTNGLDICTGYAGATNDAPWEMLYQRRSRSISAHP